MKISHTQLNNCLLQPRQWLRDIASPKTGFKMSYKRVLKYAIGKYHKTTSPLDARHHLKLLIAKHNLKTQERIDEVEVALDLYMKWHQDSEISTADSNTPILLDVGGYLELSGLVSRVDVTDSGYQGILLGTKDARWKDQLRMPLIQKALAEKYVRPVQDVMVGIQAIDGSSLEVVTFSPSQIREAEREFKDLGERIKAMTR